MAGAVFVLESLAALAVVAVVVDVVAAFLVVERERRRVVAAGSKSTSRSVLVRLSLAGAAASGDAARFETRVATVVLDVFFVRLVVEDLAVTRPDERVERLERTMVADDELGGWKSNECTIHHVTDALIFNTCKQNKWV
jgi:hypothetical protein